MRDDTLTLSAREDEEAQQARLSVQALEHSRVQDCVLNPAKTLRYWVNHHPAR